MKIFLICPIRGIDQGYNMTVVNQLENAGHVVYYPARDTDQVDDTGLRICQDNRNAIEKSDIVYVVWDGKSQGGLFDLGMAFALRKPLVVVSVPNMTDGKSFQNMMMEWCRVGP